MKGNARTRSPKVQKYMQQAYKKSNLTYREIAYKTLQPENSIEMIFEEGAIPSNYQLFVRVSELVKLSDKKLEELRTKDYPFIFTYWDILKPEAPSSSYFGRFLKNKYEEKGFTRQQIIELSGKTPGGLSLIFNGKAALSWPTLSLVLDIIKVTPKDFLEEFEKTGFQSYSYQFFQTIEDARQEKGLSKKDTATACNMTLKRYEKVSSGNGSVLMSELNELSESLDIPLNRLTFYAKRAGILVKKSIPVSDKKIWKLFSILSSYEYIDSDTYKLESHTLVVLLILILINKKHKYRAQIMYYLNNLLQSGNLALILYSPEGEGMTNIELINYYKDVQGYTYAQISQELDISGAAIFEFLGGRSIPHISTITAVCDFLDVPVSVALEYISESGSAKGTRELVDIFATIDTAVKWTYEDKSYSAEKVRNIFEIIYSKNSAYNKYNQLVKIVK